MPMGELPLDEVASQPSEVERPVLVHSCCRLGHSANPPVSDSRSVTGFGPWPCH